MIIAVLIKQNDNLCMICTYCLAGCLDMVAVEGQFTFTAERPQLSCAAFFMAEPNEVITVDYDNVDIDCRGGDFITVNYNNLSHR